MNFSIAAISIYLFGPVRVMRDGHRCTIKYNKAKALLAYLALEPGFHTRDALADRLWPDVSTTGGRDRLKRMVYHLKEVLGDSLLLADRQTVRLDTTSRVWVDALQFKALSTTALADCEPGDPARAATLARAMRLYRGPFLQGLTIADAPGLEQWIETRATELDQRQALVLRRLAQGFGAVGDYRNAVRHARLLIAHAPTDEGNWRILIKHLIDAGEPEEARLELMRCREALLAELDTRPSRATEALLDTPSSVAPAPPAAPSRGQERRRITVAFCEPCTPPGTDPEDTLHACRSALDTATALMEKNFAHTIAVPGGLFAYFGYPSALEGSAGYAVSAALKACAGILSVPGTSLEVRLRIGIHSALVVNSPQTGSPDLAGVASRVAARIAARALPGEVVVSNATWELLDFQFNRQPAGTFDSEPSEPPLALYRIEPAPAAHSTALPKALLGRASALARLSVLHHAGRAVLVTGEAGIGKSLLLRYWCARESLATVLVECNMESANEPLRPFRRWLGADTGERVRNPAGPETGTETEAQAEQPSVALARRQSLLEFVRESLMAAVPAGTVLLVEDIHWADSSSLALLESLVSLPLPGRFLVLTTRPMAKPVLTHVSLESVALKPLKHADTYALIDATRKGARLTLEQYRAIEALCDGIPLYIVECTRALLRAGDQAAVPTLPASLHDLLMARIDAAGKARYIAQLAASSGTEFSVPLLAHAARLDDSVIRAGLMVLVRHDLVVPAAEAGTFAFRHALLREAAYQSQTSVTARAAHARIARALMHLEPDLSSREPGRLAWHLLRSEQFELALEHLIEAGKQASLRYAHAEALKYYNEALDVLDRVPSLPERTLREVELRAATAMPLLGLHGYGMPAAHEALDTACRLAATLGEEPRLFPVFWRLWLTQSAVTNFHDRELRARMLVRLAHAHPLPTREVHASFALGSTVLCLGRLDEAIHALERSVACTRTGEELSPILHRDMRTVTLAWLSWAYWFTGRFDASLTMSHASIACAHETADLESICYAYAFASVLHFWRREIDRGEELAREIVARAYACRSTLWRTLGEALLGMNAVVRGDEQGAAAMIERMSELGKVMAGVETKFYALLAGACAQTAGMHRPGLDAAERGLAGANASCEWLWIAGLQHAYGLGLLGSFPERRETALDWLERALRSAQALHLTPLILTTASTLVKHGEGPARAAALDALRTTLDALSGGDELADVIEARTLCGAQASRGEERRR